MRSGRRLRLGVSAFLVMTACSKAYDLYIANPCNEDLEVVVSTTGSGDWQGEVGALSIEQVDDAVGASPTHLEVPSLGLSQELQGGRFLIVGGEKAYHVVIPAEACE